jgi:3-oxoacyl-[acyl-carrier-protein] synthase-1
MNRIFVASHNITSPLGKTSSDNFERVAKGESCVCLTNDLSILPEPFQAAMFQNSEIVCANGFTRFEQICIQSIEETLKQFDAIINTEDTLFILSTTKGNIELIENSVLTEELRNKVSLSTSAKKIAGHFNFKNQPIVVSNACISGVMAINIAQRFILAGRYKHVIVTGADVLSKFIISGFKSLSAISDEPCRPFDSKRNGINLGECASTIILTDDESLNVSNPKISVGEGAITNDANHISGPSRTGLELSFAINSAMTKSRVKAEELSFISAHGTATLYNDEMEAKAFSHSGLSEVPLHSLKPNFGHTLGAAGVLESVLTCISLQNGVVLPSLNFETSGVSESVCVNTTLKASNKKHALKTASGFGGCNAAIIFSIN